MKKKIIIIFFAFLVLLAAIISYKALVKEKISMVLPNDVVEINDDKEFSGPNWGIKSVVCKQGGFDIISYAGKEISIQSSLAVGKFYNSTPLNIYKIYVDNKIICEYYADNTGSLAPGIFAINDPNVTGQKNKK